MSSQKEQPAQEPTEQQFRQRRKHALSYSRPRPLRKDDGIFKIIGIGDSGVPGGYSWRKHEIADCGQKHHPLSE